MPKENQTPTNETPIHQPSIPDLVTGPDNVYIQNSQEMPEFFTVKDVLKNIK